MIYIHPIGGVGNMLFHIASVWSFAKDNNDDLCLVDVPGKIRALKADPRANLVQADHYRYFLDRFKHCDRAPGPVYHHTFVYSPIPYRNNFAYVGYFQSEKYFKHRRDEILELFRPGDDFLHEIDKYKDLFGNISLHVRRNDYVKIYPHIHPPQTPEYYERALELLPKDLKVVVFSDDIAWSRETFKGDRYVIMDEIDYVSLYVMSKMNHHVIANSSFSWWGAWMSEYEDKKIIAPDKWFGPTGENYRDIVPENWIKI